MKSYGPSLAAFAALSLSVTYVQTAHALQPLDLFIQSARKYNFDARESTLVAEQRAAEAETAGRRLWPTLSARGVYTRNQYEAVVRTPGPNGAANEAVIVPQDQLDAFLSIDVPIVDFSNWARKSAANATRDSAAARGKDQRLSAQQAVVRGYYQLLAARSVLAASVQTVDAATQNLKVQEQRKAAGLANQLDYQRAVAEVERGKQLVASAEYIESSQGRALATLSGLAPEGGGVLPEDDLHEEAPLTAFLRTSDGAETPALAAARLEARAADKTASSQWYVLAPSIAANATERLTNATGFQNRSAIYTLSATLSWKLDFSTLSQGRAQEAAASVGQLRHERALRTQSDSVQDAWELVRSSAAGCRAARAEAIASRLALKMAAERYAAGTSLQLEVLQANRSAFQAEVARLQSDADLCIARSNLAIVSGKISAL